MVSFRPRPDGGLARWGRLAARHPVRILVLVLVLSVGIGAGFTQARLANIDELFLPGSLDEVKAANRIEDLYGTQTAELVLAELPGRLNATTARQVLALEAALAESHVVEAVEGLGALVQSVGGAGSSDDTLEQTLRDLQDNRSAALSRVVTEPWVLLRVRINASASDAAVVEGMDTALGTEEASFVSLQATGPSHIRVDQSARGANDLQFLMPIALIFVFIVLWVGTASARASLIAIGIQSWAVVLAFATLPWLGVPFSPLLYSIGLLILGLGIDYQLHLLYAFTEREPAEPKPTRWAGAIGRAGRPVFFTVATTMIGFGSFLASPIPQIQHWGLLILLGAGYSFLLGVTLLPAWIGPSIRKGRWRTPGWIGRTASGLGSFVWKGRAPILIVALIATAAMGWSASRTTVAEGIGADAGTEGPIYEALDTVEARFGGQDVILVLVDSPPESAWIGLDETSRRLAAISGTARVDSETQRARLVSGDTLPEPRRSAPQEGPPLSTGSTTLIFVFTAPENASNVASSVKEVLSDAPLRGTATGLPVLEALGPQLVLDGLFRSTGVAFGLILVVLLSVFRRLRSTLAALTPLLVVLVWQFGAMRFLGLELNAVTAVTTAMIIGIGVDFALHLVADVERGLETHGIHSRSVREAVGHVGMALLTGGFTTVGVFLILSLSQQSQVQQFGSVSAIVVAAAFVLAIGLLPLFYLKRPLGAPFDAQVHMVLACPACTSVHRWPVAHADRLLRCPSCGEVSPR